MRLIDRRLVVVVLAALSLAACHKGPAGGAATSDDMSLGNPNAKITLIEYASVACPICAEFNNTVFPQFKAKYIDTGKVHYVMREALTGNPDLAASGFLLARCAGKDKYFAVTDAVFRAQDQLYEPGTETIRGTAARDVLLHIAENAGLSEDQFSKCLADDKAITALNDRVEKSSQRDHVDGTPMFILNGKKLRTGGTTLADLDAAIQPLLK